VGAGRDEDGKGGKGLSRNSAAEIGVVGESVSDADGALAVEEAGDGLGVDGGSNALDFEDGLGNETEVGNETFDDVPVVLREDFDVVSGPV
jgi:hypothetical protein